MLIPAVSLCQKAVVLQHNGMSTIYSTPTPFVDAYNASANGDTIYLPGGLFAPPASINKRLVIYGAGHYPDSTATTGVTTINGRLTLEENADNTVLQGLNVTEYIYFADNKRVDSVVVYRCNTVGILIAGGYDTATNCRGVLLYQNVAVNIILSHGTNPRVFNNICSSIGNSASNAWIRNNKVDVISEISYSLIENNTIAQYQSWNCNFNTLRNNILSFGAYADNSTWLNNYSSVDWNNLFVKQTVWFSYTDDYHLKTPGNYPGTDGVQSGIYGGFYPYKEGSVPSNPHVQTKNIPLQTDVSGQLNVQLKVAAQNN